MSQISLKSIKLPYSLSNILKISILSLALIIVPLKIFAAIPIELGVDAYTEHIASELKGLTYVYKYVVGQGWQSYVSTFINTAYANNFKPVIVFYTNFDSTTPDFVAWDQVMNTIKTDGREVWVVVEPDMWAYIKNEGKCASLGKQHVDRFLSTKATNVHLGFFISPWNVPYVGATDDAADWKTCWSAAGGDRMEDIYVDVSDRDQEFKGEYPWSASKITMFEDWFKALNSDTGRKITVWQIPMGNSTCNNGRRSNLVETWLTSAKLAALSPYVNRMLFGPGIETGSSAQSWNLAVQDKYDCGLFNNKITELAGVTPGDTQAPTVSITAPTGGSTVSGTVNVNANATDNIGVTKVEFLVDGSLKNTDTASLYSFSWDTTTVSNGSHILSAKAYDAANNVGTSTAVSVTVNNISSLTVNLKANNLESLSGSPPLAVNLSADIAGSATGTINYSFWWNCNNSGTSVGAVSTACGALPQPTAGTCTGNSIGYKCVAVASDPQLSSTTYSTGGAYTAKVITERGLALPAEDRVSITVTINALPDLIAQSLAQSIASPVVGDSLTFSGQIKNQGNTGAGASSARFCIDNPDCLNTVTGRVGSDLSVPALTAGSTAPVTTSPFWTATEGTHTVYLCADITKVISEADETNNCSSLSFIVTTSPESGGFTGQYYDNKDFTNLKLTRTDAAINFEWGNGSPDPSIAVDTFSVRWTGDGRFDAGTYTFKVKADDGIRIWIDGTQVLNKWFNQPATTYTFNRTLTAGIHKIIVEYYENTGAATAVVDWSIANSLEAENMVLPSDYGQVFNDSNASGGKALLIWSNTAAAGQLSGSAKNVTVRARGDQCSGAPHMVVYIDTQKVIDTYVSSKSWKDYSALADITAGNHTVTVIFDNDRWTNCDRNLRVDKISFMNY